MMNLTDAMTVSGSPAIYTIETLRSAWYRLHGYADWRYANEIMKEVTRRGGRIVEHGRIIGWEDNDHRLHLLSTERGV